MSVLDVLGGELVADRDAPGVHSRTFAGEAPGSLLRTRCPRSGKRAGEMAETGRARARAPRRCAGGDLVARQVAARAGLRALAALEVEGLAQRSSLSMAPAEARRRPARRSSGSQASCSSGQHAALARADARARQLRALREGDLRLLAEGAEAHVADEQRDVEVQRLAGGGTDHQLGGDLLVLEQGLGGELRGQQLEVVPARQLRRGNAHGGHHAVVSEHRQAVACQALDVGVVRLLGRAVHVL